MIDFHTRTLSLSNCGSRRVCAACCRAAPRLAANTAASTPDPTSIIRMAPPAITRDGSADGLLLHVLRQPTAGSRAGDRPLGAVDVAVRVDRHAFAGRAPRVVGLVRRNERQHLVLGRLPDAHTGAPIRMALDARLRIDGVQRIVPSDEETADAAELPELIE